MKVYACWLPCLAVFPLSAGSIDVSGATTVLLDRGDSLIFDISTSNYTQYAINLGLPRDPTSVRFEVISSVLNAPPAFAAELYASDGSAAAALGAPVNWSPGVFSSSAYSGEVSALEGFFQLTAEASDQIFGGMGAELILRNLGPAVMLGLPPINLRQDLFVSLSSGPLEVGAMNGAVRMQEAPADVPEPHPGALLIVGALICCLAERLFLRGILPMEEP